MSKREHSDEVIIKEEEDGDGTQHLKKKKKSLMNVIEGTLPGSGLYEQSYMHRDVITHIVVARGSDFILTASIDGQVKFWKKTIKSIEFIKTFQAHRKRITALSVSPDDQRFCTTSSDQRLKIFDILHFDMTNILDLHYVPSNALWLNDSNIVVSDLCSKHLRVYNANGETSSGTNNEEHASCLKVLADIHSSPLTCMVLNTRFDTVISIDLKGMIEYWNRNEFTMPNYPKDVAFQYKYETDLYELAKKKTTALSVSISPYGDMFAVVCADKHIRIFAFKSGKLIDDINEERSVYEKAIVIEAADAVKEEKDDGMVQVKTEEGEEDATNVETNGGKKVDLSNLKSRLIYETDLDNTLESHLKYLQSQAVSSMESSSATVTTSTGASSSQLYNTAFDNTGSCLLYSSLEGIKVYDLTKKQVLRVLGGTEYCERFIGLALYQGIPKIDKQYILAQKLKAGAQASDPDTMNELNQPILPDPTIFCTSMKSPRFFLFSNRMPADMAARDIYNENSISSSDKDGVKTEKDEGEALPTAAVLRTTKGDIHFELFPKECPKAVENWATHARNGYYKNLIFHRVIKGFMIQTGDPEGDGTGGSSIWGKDFEDEFSSKRRHGAFALSMANAGPNTNGSQFFITTSVQHHLDNKHTCFGSVKKGFDTVQEIEKVQVNKHDKPFKDIKILDIDIL